MAERRADPTVTPGSRAGKKTYTLAEFIEFYGRKRGTQMWNKADQHSPAKLDKKDPTAQRGAAAVRAEAVPGGKLTLTYFPLMAKGLAPALALEWSGLEWAGHFPSSAEGIPAGGDPGGFGGDFKAWGQLKPKTPFGHLPTLAVPGVGTIGHEGAILAFIGRRGGMKMNGASEKDFSMSAMLLSEGEDLYQKLIKHQDTCLQKKDPKEVSDEDNAKIWSADDTAGHNRDQGFPVHLAKLEALHSAAGQAAGRFTTSGATVGELKLWAVLHQMTLVKGDCLKPFPAVSAFYDRVAAAAATKRVLDKGGRYPGVLKQYFMPR